jgi:hypothetical protein
MADFDEKPYEALSEEELDEVAGGSFDPRDDYRRCPAGVMVPRKKGCSSCHYYHQTATHWCSIMERKGKS